MEYKIAINLKDQPRCNGEIRSPEVRLIDANGDMLGVMSSAEAQRLARERGLDLVEISPNTNPPVCKILEYSKYKYELQKKAKLAKKNQKVVETKEVKVRPTIAEGDYQVKLKNAIRFLEDGDKVRFSLQFKGREVTHEEVGYNVINKFKRDLDDIAKVEVQPKKEGKQIFMIMVPK
jgi:translation initiation factor IF-3